MNWFKSVLITVGPRLIGAGIAAISGLIYTHTKGAVTVDGTMVTEMATTMLVTYAAGHRAASSIINPGDAAKGRVSEAIKSASDSPGNSSVIIPPSNH